MDRLINRLIDGFLTSGNKLKIFRQYTKDISTKCSYLICFDLKATFNWVLFKTLVEITDRQIYSQTDRHTDRLSDRQPKIRPTDRQTDNR